MSKLRWTDFYNKGKAVKLDGTLEHLVAHAMIWKGHGLLIYVPLSPDGATKRVLERIEVKSEIQ